MLDVPRLLMVVGGLGLAAIGVRKKQMLDVGIGACFVGSAWFGHLARSDPMYGWLQLACSVAMGVLVVLKFLALRRQRRK